MKKLVFLFLLMTGMAWGQGSIIPYPGVPSGTCAPTKLGLNLANGHLYACNNGTWLEIGPGAAGAAAWNTITAGTNTGQALLVGNGSSLDVTGSGTINATSYNGIGAATVSATEFGYLDGVTSAIQTQLNAKAAALSGLTTSAMVSAASSSTIQTPSAGSTLDASGNATFAGTVKSGGSGFFPSTAAGGAAGSTSLPFSGLVIGGAANNTAAFTGTFTGNRTVHVPDSNTFLPISAQHITWSGPTASRTYTLPDLNSTIFSSASPYTDIVQLWASGSCVGFLKNDGTCSNPAGSGTVTVVGAGSLTSTAFMTGGGTTTAQTPSATSTLDSSGNAVFAGSVSSGTAPTACGSAVGCLAQISGATRPTGQAGAITIAGNNGGTAILATLNGGGEINVLTSAGLAAIASGKTFTVSNTMTQTATDGSTVAFGAGGTVLYSGARRWSCQPGIGDGTNAVTAATYLESICYNDTGSTVTITGLKCFTDNSGSSTMNAAGNTLGALLTGAVTCTSSFAAGTQSANVALTAGDYIKFTWVLDGTSKQLTSVVTGTY